MKFKLTFDSSKSNSKSVCIDSLDITIMTCPNVVGIIPKTYGDYYKLVGFLYSIDLFDYITKESDLSLRDETGDEEKLIEDGKGFIWIDLDKITKKFGDEKVLHINSITK